MSGLPSGTEGCISVLKICYQVGVLVLRGPAEVPKAIGGGYAEVIHVARNAFRSGVRARFLEAYADGCLP